MNAPAVLIDVDQHRMTITLNRPDALNAINLALSDGLLDAMEQAEADPEIRVVVLAGSGRGFCAGADLKAAARGEVLVRPERTERFRYMTTKPWIAAVNGLAYGGGAELALSADLAVAAASARFALPEVTRGLIAAGGGAFRLAEQLPRKLALRMLLTGAPIDAQTALTWGLINEVVPDDDVLAAAHSLADEIARNAPLAVQATKRIAYSVDDAGHRPWEDEGYRITARETAINSATQDAQEGPRAFAEKRAPSWTGR